MNNQGMEKQNNKKNKKVLLKRVMGVVCSGFLAGITTCISLAATAQSKQPLPNGCIH